MHWQKILSNTSETQTDFAMINLIERKKSRTAIEKFSTQKNRNQPVPDYVDPYNDLKKYCKMLEEKAARK